MHHARRCGQCAAAGRLPLRSKVFDEIEFRQRAVDAIVDAVFRVAPECIVADECMFGADWSTLGRPHQTNLYSLAESIEIEHTVRKTKGFFSRGSFISLATYLKLTPRRAASCFTVSIG